ncbi:MAG: DnaD domain protein [Bacilli bacterium]|nr:DnaD domain protein [Bacilli bacterium]
MTGKLINLLKDGSIIVPKILLTNYQQLNIDEKELILLIYLIYNNEFNPEKIAENLKMKPNEFLNLVNSLSKKDIIKIKNKTKNNKREEYISLDELYNKLALIIMDEEKKEVTTVYDTFEREFGRTLSSMEYEIIGAWKDQNFTDELIILALKEAVYNGVYKLNYIDKILYNWKKEGINTKKDLNNHKVKPKKEVTKEIEDLDWLND